jgi:hypothetical protein
MSGLPFAGLQHRGLRAARNERGFIPARPLSDAPDEKPEDNSRMFNWARRLVGAETRSARARRAAGAAAAPPRNNRSESAKAASAGRRTRRAAGAAYRGKVLGNIGKAIYNAPGKAVGFLGSRLNNAGVLASRLKHLNFRRTRANANRAERNRLRAKLGRVDNRYKSGYAREIVAGEEKSARAASAKARANASAARKAASAARRAGRIDLVAIRREAERAHNAAVAAAGQAEAARAALEAAEAAAGNGSARSGSASP